MNWREEISHGYQSATERTLQRWQENPGVGVVRDAPFYPTEMMAVTTGIKISPPMPILQLIGDLAALTRNDPLADVMQEQGLHFTFLALSTACYQSGDDIKGLPALREIVTDHCLHQELTLQHLQLVALPNQLLLAGYPQEETWRLRTTLVEKLVSSPWRSTLEERYKNDPLPPLFWHSTLLRYRADYLPGLLRTYFLQHQHVDYGTLSAPIMLQLANYTWLLREDLA